MIKEARGYDDVSRGLVFLDIYKDGCKPCEQLIPVLEELSVLYSQCSFYKTPCTNEEVVRGLGIRTDVAPTIVLLKDGKVIEHFSGARYSKGAGSERVAEKKERLRNKLDRFLGRYYQSPVQDSVQVQHQHPASLETRLGLSENSLVTLRERYLLKDENGKIIESPEDLFTRVAANIAQADRKYGKSEQEVEMLKREFYEVMANLQFMPNSPTLMNAGRDLQQLSACFVLPVDDSVESIFEASKNGAVVHKSGGGTGYSFSKLRPKNSRVRSTSGIASGPVSFMYAFNIYTDVVKQGGTRRGANMGILRVDHPDIRDFIHAKGELDDKNKSIVEAFKKYNNLGDEDPAVTSLKRNLLEKTQLNNFNISVGVTKEFMEAVERDEDFPLVDPHTEKPARRIKARELLEEITEQAWRTGDPGIIFLDRINEHNPTPQAGEIEATNPCGEQPLLPYESCNLGSINLSKFVTSQRGIDYDGLRRVVHTAVHFLDNVIDMNKYPISEIETMTRANRKIGLGVMGFADMISMMKIPYGTDESLKVAEEVMRFIRDEARKASVELAGERGVFPNWEGSIYDSKSPHFKGEELRLRNATVTTIAPTGSISMIAECESGIEPSFSLAYTKTVMDGKVLHYRARGLEHVLRQEGFDVEAIFSELEQGKRDRLEQLPEGVKKLAVTSMTLTPEQHIRAQAAFQKYTDNAVSKTINLPNSATREDIEQAYLLAYKLGCKGITVYRDGSKYVQVLETKVQEYKFGSQLPKERVAIVRQEMVGDGKRVFVTVGYWEDEMTRRIIESLRKNGRPTEFFVSANFFDPRTQSLLNALSIRCSKDLRRGVPIEEIVNDLENLPPSDEVGYDEVDGNPYVNRSIPEAIGRAVIGWKPSKGVVEARKIEIPEETGKAEKTENPKEDNRNKNYGYCENCGKFGIVRREGCDRCIHCGFSSKGCE